MAPSARSRPASTCWATTSCELDGDEGRASCYFQAQHVLDGTEGGTTYIVAGTYRDRVVRTPEGWKIAERQLTVLWTQGNERVLHPARA